MSSTKMRVSFDLDEVLFVNPADHKTEEPLPFLLGNVFRERLRLGTPKLIRSLQDLGYEVWVYTSSFRSEWYIRTLFKCYGVRFDGIINGERHLKEVQRDRKERLTQTMPTFYRTSLHVDDETVVVTYGKQYGFDVFQLDAQDDDWKEKVIARAEQIRKRKLILP